MQNIQTNAVDGYLLSLRFGDILRLERGVIERHFPIDRFAANAHLHAIESQRFGQGDGLKAPGLLQVPVGDADFEASAAKRERARSGAGQRGAGFQEVPAGDHGFIMAPRGVSGAL